MPDNMGHLGRLAGARVSCRGWGWDSSAGLRAETAVEDGMGRRQRWLLWLGQNPSGRTGHPQMKSKQMPYDGSSSWSLRSLAIVLAEAPAGGRVLHSAHLPTGGCSAMASSSPVTLAASQCCLHAPGRILDPKTFAPLASVPSRPQSLCGHQARGRQLPPPLQAGAGTA